MTQPERSTHLAWHKTKEEAEAALAAFIDDVKAAVERHRLVAVIAAAEAHYPETEDDPGRLSGTFQSGQVTARFALAASTYGAARAAHEDFIGACIADGQRARRGRDTP